MKLFARNLQIISKIKMARIIKLRSEGDLQLAVQEAVKVIGNGGIIALPTDTIYGISTLLQHSEKIYNLKQRSHEKPLGLFVSDPNQIHKFSKVTVSKSLLDSLLPGPVTLIFSRSSGLPDDFNPTTENVGVRVPDHKFVQQLTQEFPDEPIAQTSANLSGSPESPLCIEDFQNLWPFLDLIIDAGPIVEHQGNRNGSTIIDLSVKGCFHVVRDGCAKDETIKKLKEHGLHQME